MKFSRLPVWQARWNRATVRILFERCLEDRSLSVSQADETKKFDDRRVYVCARVR